MQIPNGTIFWIWHIDYCLLRLLYLSMALPCVLIVIPSTTQQAQMVFLLSKTQDDIVKNCLFCPLLKMIQSIAADSTHSCYGVAADGSLVLKDKLRCRVYRKSISKKYWAVSDGECVLSPSLEGWVVRGAGAWWGLWSFITLSWERQTIGTHGTFKGF